MEAIQLRRPLNQVENPRQLIGVADNIFALFILCDTDMRTDIKGKMALELMLLQYPVRHGRVLCTLHFTPPKIHQNVRNLIFFSFPLLYTK